MGEAGHKGPVHILRSATGSLQFEPISKTDSCDQARRLGKPGKQHGSLKAAVVASRGKRRLAGRPDFLESRLISEHDPMVTEHRLF